MNVKVKKLWLKALRSGKYTQGKHSLRSEGGDTFCCLGVLCDVYLKTTGRGNWDGKVFMADDDDNSAEPPAPVAEWAGLQDPNPTLGNRSNSASAASLNDRGETFEYIANRIEQYL